MVFALNISADCTLRAQVKPTGRGADKFLAVFPHHRSSSPANVSITADILWCL